MLYKAQFDRLNQKADTMLCNREENKVKLEKATDCMVSAGSRDYESGLEVATVFFELICTSYTPDVKVAVMRVCLAQVAIGTAGVQRSVLAQVMPSWLTCWGTLWNEPAVNATQS